MMLRDRERAADLVCRRESISRLTLAGAAAALLIWVQPATGQARLAASKAMQRGGKAMAAGDFPAAIAAYSTATSEAPNFAEGYLNLGLALEQSGKLEEARSALQRALHLNPADRGANLFLGIADYRLNHYQEAAAALERETRLDPRSAKAFMWLGVCRLAQSDAQGAVAALDKAYALDPKDVDILFHRGRAYMLVANASYDAMFRMDRDSVRVHQVLGEAYAQSYRTDSAIDEFEVAVKMAPQQPGLHEELADQYWAAGKVEEAAAAYRSELKMDPHSATTLFKLGCLMVEHQQPDEGVQLLAGALHEDPSLADAHYYRGNGLVALGRDEEAIGEFQAAIAADPGDDRAISTLYKLAQIYKRLRRTTEAQAAMAKFQHMREVRQTRQQDRIAQVARKRSDLPIEDPERIGLAAQQGDKTSF
jgi:tetratricopeptide (TPR) repeat protein